jgi:hypothetical protein
MRARKIARRLRAVLNGTARDLSWQQPLIDLADRALQAVDHATKLRRLRELEGAVRRMRAAHAGRARREQPTSARRAAHRRRRTGTRDAPYRSKKLVNLFDALARAPVLRLGVNTDKFATWLRRAVAEVGTKSRRDESSRAADPSRAPTPEGATPEDIGLLLGIATPQERRLAELLARGLSTEEAARNMHITEQNARQILARLRGRA